MSDELPPDVHVAILHFCARGDELANGENFREAIVEFNKAWALLPEPKDHWEAATWVLAAIGDCAFLGGLQELARQAFDDVMVCPGALGNAFLHLRRGQVLFDAGELDGAADELMRALMAGGREVFDTEPPEYFEFLSTRAAV